MMGPSFRSFNNGVGGTFQLIMWSTRDQAAERWIGGIMQSKARNFRLIARRTVLMMSLRIGRLNALLGEQAYPNKVRGVWGKMVAGERYRPFPTRLKSTLFSPLVRLECSNTGYGGAKRNPSALPLPLGSRFFAKSPESNRIDVNYLCFQSIQPTRIHTQPGDFVYQSCS